MKAFTDLEQSKKLAEILPLESADMHYNNASIKGINCVDEYRAELMDYNTAQKVLTNYLVNSMFGIIPCWSLAALLDVLPVGTESHKQSDGSISYYYVEVYNNKKYFYAKRYDNPVDACVAMIEKLHELNLL